jgi:hypothetical protein
LINIEHLYLVVLNLRMDKKRGEVTFSPSNTGSAKHYFFRRRANAPSPSSTAVPGSGTGAMADEILTGPNG